MEEIKKPESPILSPQRKMIAEIYQEGDRIVLHPLIPMPFLNIAGFLNQLAGGYIGMELQRQQKAIMVAPPIPGLRAPTDKGNGS